jgi:hypothetical protein
MPTILERICPNCGLRQEVVVENSKFDRWQQGENIQNVWPEKTPMERELIKTGFCSDECWLEYLGPGEE